MFVRAALLVLLREDFGVIKLASKLPHPVAYAFGGGGSYGAVQVGQLKAMGQTDVRPDFCVGTSVGSLNGLITAENPDTAVERLEYFWNDITRRHVFGSRRRAIANVALLQPSAADPGPLIEYIKKATKSRDFKDLQLPHTAVTVDADTGQRVDISSGDLISACMASCCIPGVFPIVEREGRKLMDGGLVENVPIRVAAEQGAKTIVVFDCGFTLFGPKTSPTIAHTLLRAASIVASSQVNRDLAAYSDIHIVYVPGRWPPAGMPTDFGTMSALNIQASYSIAMEWLYSVKIKGPGLYGHPPDAAKVDTAQPSVVNQIREVVRRDSSI